MSERNEVRGRCQRGMRCGESVREESGAGEVLEGNEVRERCQGGMRCRRSVRGE